VTMRDIADALGIRQASLYYHAPAGKEQLFVEVTEQGFIRHRQELEQIIAVSEKTIAAQFRAVALWLLSQPPLDFTRFFRSDLPALSEQHRYRLADLAHIAWLAPIEQIIMEAYERGEIRLVNQKTMAVSFITNVEAIHDMQRYVTISKEVLAQDVIDVLLDGLRRR